MTSPSAAYPVIRALKGHAKRLRRGHPWIFSNEIAMDPATKAIAPGSLVRLLDAGDEALGVGTFNPHSLIAFRLFERSGEAVVIDGAWIKARLHRAMSLRATLWDKPYGRLVHGEADGLPGLIVDRFGDVCSIQVNTAGMEHLTPLVLQGLSDIFGTKSTVLLNTSPVRALEGLPIEVRIVGEAFDDPVVVEENGFFYLVSLADGQKTGWFYDQRLNRAFVAGLAKGRRVLDVCSYAGGFGLLALSRGAASAQLVDRSQHGLDLAMESARRAGLDQRLSIRTGEAFDVLENLGRTKERFGVVICDPPAFAKSRKDVGPAAKGYRKMARLGAELVEPGGFFFMASCSHHMVLERFHEEVVHGLDQAGRTGRIIATTGASPDHPVHPMLPESTYLKTLTFQLD